MRGFVFGLALTLVACSEAHAPAPREAPRALVFNAASETARNFTGDLRLEGDRLVFAKGAVLLTRPLSRHEPAEPIAQGGPSFAAAALGSSDVVVEVRDVAQQTLGQGAPALCPAGAPTYIALIYGPRSTRVTLMVFNGREPPGPSASKSFLCATYVYAAPDGVRTRQGVLL
jgi:hypothetical protein